MDDGSRNGGRGEGGRDEKVGSQRRKENDGKESKDLKKDPPLTTFSVGGSRLY